VSEEGVERKLTTILAADVVGYSRLMGEDEAGTLARLKSLRKDLMQPKITGGRGRIVKLMGDGLLAEFPSVVEAVRCAIDIQQDMVGREPGLPDEGRLRLRIGVNLGDIIVEGSDIYGDGVNVAARLEGLAEPGGICISSKVYEEVRNKLTTVFEDLGEQEVKNIREPVRVYRWTDAAADPMPSIAGAEGAPPLPDKPSIAVLPFTNMSGDQEQEHLSDGISEDIITALSKIPKLFVTARNSTFTYKGRAVDVKQVGREQGVRYVLEGSVRRSGDQLRITAQLIDATTGDHVWAQRYDRFVQDVFALQDEITREVTSALQVELTDGEQARLWASGTQNFEAWEIVIQIPELIYSHRKEHILMGRRLAEQALLLDKNYAAAWTMLGLSHWEEAFNGWSENPEASLNLAVDAAAHSQSIDDSNPDTFALLTWIHLSLRKYDQAFDLAQQAMVLGPNNSFVVGVASDVAMFCNRPHDMVVLLNKAMRLCPIYPAWYPSNMAWAYLLMDRREDAIASAQTSSDIDPDYPFNYMVLAIAFAESEREQEAHTAVENLLRIDPKYSLRTFSECQPFRDAEVLDRHIEGLRKAGLPE
jgi:adenylate cyclase